MSDYIDRQAVLSALFELVEARSEWISPEGVSERRGIDAAICEVIDAPSADVEPVVRCKDCVVLQTCRFAQWLGLDGYCSQGKKMDGEEHEL